jgi:hypothetical protein
VPRSDEFGHIGLHGVDLGRPLGFESLFPIAPPVRAEAKVRAEPGEEPFLVDPIRADRSEVVGQRHIFTREVSGSLEVSLDDLATSPDDCMGTPDQFVEASSGVLLVFGLALVELRKKLVDVGVAADRHNRTVL